VKGIQSDETLSKIEAGTFKTIPGEGKESAHASCFKCHWEKSKPFKDDCSGCHLSSLDYKTGKNPVTGKELVINEPPPFSPNAEKWFKDWPVDVPKRFTLKFRHQGAGHVSEGCNTCHVNIARMTTLYIPKADVQVGSCAECHSKEPIPVMLGESVTLCDELKLKEDPGKAYICVACHAASIGREQPPDSHYFREELCADSGQPGKE